MKIRYLPLWFGKGATMWEMQVWRFCIGIRYPGYWRTSGVFWFMWDEEYDQ